MAEQPLDSLQQALRKGNEEPLERARQLGELIIRRLQKTPVTAYMTEARWRQLEENWNHIRTDLNQRYNSTADSDLECMIADIARGYLCLLSLAQKTGPVAAGKLKDEDPELAENYIRKYKNGAEEAYQKVWADFPRMRRLDMEYNLANFTYAWHVKLQEKLRGMAPGTTDAISIQQEANDIMGSLIKGSLASCCKSIAAKTHTHDNRGTLYQFHIPREVLGTPGVTPPQPQISHPNNLVIAPPPTFPSINASNPAMSNLASYYLERLGTYFHRVLANLSPTPSTPRR